MDSTLLEVDNLSVTYRRNGKTIKAVRDVSLGLAPGEALGIVGESGCGKSSLARAILQLEKYRGRVKLNGKDLAELSRRELRTERRHMQAVFQDPLASLDPRMSIGEAIAEPLRVHAADLRATEREKHVHRALEKVGLDLGLAGRYPHELSGGQCQRVGIARAIICEPRLLVCDEPVSALDTSVRGQVLGLLESLRREIGIAIVFIAHDMTAVRYLCERVVVMKQGGIVESGTREEIFTRPREDYTKALLAAVLPPDPDTQPPPIAEQKASS